MRVQGAEMVEFVRRLVRGCARRGRRWVMRSFPDWRVWRSPYGGVIVRCPWGQLTIRPPGSLCLYSDLEHRYVLGWRFIFRSFM